MLHGGLSKAGSSGNGGEHPMRSAAGRYPHQSRRGNDPGDHTGAEVMLNDFKCGCPVYLACGYTDARDRWSGGAGTDAVPVGSIPNKLE